MKLSITLSTTRNEYKMITSAIHDVTGMASALSNNDPKVDALRKKLTGTLHLIPTATVNAKSKFAAMAYALKLTDTIDIEFNLEVNPDCLALQLKLAMEILEFVAPMVSAGVTMSKNLDGVKRIRQQLAEYERGFKPTEISMELSKESI